MSLAQYTKFDFEDLWSKLRYPNCETALINMDLNSGTTRDLAELMCGVIIIDDHSKYSVYLYMHNFRLYTNKVKYVHFTFDL